MNDVKVEAKSSFGATFGLCAVTVIQNDPSKAV
jgi:hypothetical protein